MNTSFYGYGKESKTYLKWSEPIVEAKIGLYSGKVTLVPENTKVFFEDLTFTTTSSAFSFDPSTFKVFTGNA